MAAKFEIVDVIPIKFTIFIVVKFQRGYLKKKLNQISSGSFIRSVLITLGNFRATSSFEASFCSFYCYHNYYYYYHYYCYHHHHHHYYYYYYYYHFFPSLLSVRDGYQVFTFLFRQFKLQSQVSLNSLSAQWSQCGSVFGPHVDYGIVASVLCHVDLNLSSDRQESITGLGYQIW